MPIFELEKDGKVYEVEADSMEEAAAAMGGEMPPADAPAQEVAQEVAAAVRPEESGFQDFAEGVGLSGLETYYGIKDLFTDLDEEDQATLKDWREDAGQSGWGTAGQIVGEIGQLALPGGLITKGAKALSKARGLSKAATAVTAASADVALSTGFEAAQMPEGVETRLGNAAVGATGALVGLGVGKVLKGLDKTKAAQRLLDEGVDLTPATATGRANVGGIEAVGTVVPFVAQGVNKARAKATETMNKTLFKKAAPVGAKIDKIGTEGVAELKKAYKAAYSDAWKGATEVPSKARVAMVDLVDEAMPRLTTQQQNVMKSIGKDFRALTRRPKGDGSNADSLKAFDNMLRKRIASASKQDIDFKDVLVKLRATLRESMPNNVKGKLDKVDSKYGDFLVVQRATKNALSETDQLITPNQLTSAVRAIGGNRAASGTAPLSRYAMDVADTIGGQNTLSPLNPLMRMAGAAPSPPGFRAAGKVAIGETAPQKAMAKYMRELEKYGIKLPLAGGAAAGEY